MPNKLDMTVNTTSAAALSWDAGDSIHGGQLTTPSGTTATSWNFSWALGDVGTHSCATDPTWTLDAPVFQMTFQPYDDSGVPGDLRTQVVAIDRSDPFQLCGFVGGRSPEHGGVIELQWRKAPEADVVSYTVMRKKQGAEPSDKVVDGCNAVTAHECVDTNPPNGTGAIDYYVKPTQDNVRGVIDGPQTDLNIPAVGTANIAPAPPANPVAVSWSQGTPTITWNAATDSDGTVDFYRVYRDGTAIGNRIGRTVAGVTQFVDNNAGGVTHNYWVSAVDNAFAESPLVGPVS
jgi:hypothetical protein